MMHLDQWSGGLWPYLALVLFGFLPSEIWRMLSVFIGRRIDEGSPLLEWVRAVSTALLAGVVANIILAPSGALATVPLVARLGAMGIGLGVYAATGKSVIGAVLAGEAAIMLFAWWFGG
ncbi:MAG: AzlD domain-containing protein [Beijerinckiaceae bacterium]